MVPLASHGVLALPTNDSASRGSEPTHNERSPIVVFHIGETTRLAPIAARAGCRQRLIFLNWSGLNAAV